MGKLGDLRVVPAVISLLADAAIADTAEAALVEIGAPAVMPLVDALYSTDISLRDKAGNTLVKIGAASVEPLISLFEGNDEDLKLTAIELPAQL